MGIKRPGGVGVCLGRLIPMVISMAMCVVVMSVCTIMVVLMMVFMVMWTAIGLTFLVSHNGPGSKPCSAPIVKADSVKNTLH
jgi:hypothetical protein